MARDKTKIINQALGEVRGQLIQSTSQGTEQADLAELIYDEIVISTYELPYEWKFCRVRAELAQHELTPAFGFSFQYIIPNWLSSILTMVSELGDDVQYRWRREALHVEQEDGTITAVKVLLTDQDTCRVRGEAFIADPNFWPGWFAELVILRIALRLEPPLKGDQQVDNRLARKYQAAIVAAIAANALEDVDVDGNGVNLDYGNDNVLNAADPLGYTDFDNILRL